MIPSLFKAKKLLSLACLAMFALAQAAQAQFPDRPVTIIVPYNTGTSADVMTRLIAAEMSKQTGANFVVQNRVGASGIIGTQAVARAAPDGYTIAYANVATLAINQSLYSSLPYDADKQLAPVALTGSVQNVLAMRPGLGVKSVQELIERAKAKPEQLIVASPGNGTTGHLSAVKFMSMTGTKFMVVPYKGGVEADLAVLRGEADIVFDNIASILPFITDKKVIPLAVTGTERDKLLPDVATLDEQGLKGYRAVAWTGYVAPAATDPKVLDYLNETVNNALRSPDVQQRLDAMAFVPIIEPRQALFDLAHEERPVWANVIRQANLKLD